MNLESLLDRNRARIVDWEKCVSEISNYVMGDRDIRRHTIDFLNKLTGVAWLLMNKRCDFKKGPLEKLYDYNSTAAEMAGELSDEHAKPVFLIRRLKAAQRIFESAQDEESAKRFYDAGMDFSKKSEDHKQVILVCTDVACFANAIFNITKDLSWARRSYDALMEECSRKNMLKCDSSNAYYKAGKLAEIACKIVWEENKDNNAKCEWARLLYTAKREYAERTNDEWHAMYAFKIAGNTANEEFNITFETSIGENALYCFNRFLEIAKQWKNSDKQIERYIRGVEATVNWIRRKLEKPETTDTVKTMR